MEELGRKELRLELWLCGTIASCLYQHKPARSTVKAGLLYMQHVGILIEPNFFASEAAELKSSNGSTDCRNLSSVLLASHKPSV